MRKGTSTRRHQKEEGIALLIAIFILLLIGVVAIALVISSGTESALAVNYRSSTSVYYAAVAGLEEVRARLRPNTPNYFGTTNPNNFLPPAGTPLGLCNPVYVLNPLGGEAVTPWDPANPYYDNEFSQEFPVDCGGAPPPSPSKWANSIWNRAPLNGLPFPGPSYKWVRINGVSEQSLNVDTWPTYDGISPSLIYYDGQHLLDTNTSGHQVYELTALAVLPNGSRKLVQYLVGPAPLTMPPFLAALTLSGSNSPGGNPSFQAPANNTVYSIIGNDYLCNGNPSGGAPVYAIGLFGDYSGGSYATDLSGLVNGNGTVTGAGIPAAPPSIRQNNYPGLGGTNPDVQYLTGYPANLQSPSQLDAVVQTITQNADAGLPSSTPSYPLPTVVGSSLDSLGMSPTNPMTVVVNGNLDLSNWCGTGYGLLLVIGTFTYDPCATWYGIVMVVGQGQVNNFFNGQYQQMNGAVFVAKTRDPGGNLLGGRIGGGSVSFGPAMQGNGIRYSSCWIQKSQPTSGYKILSFHEISQ